VAGARDLIDRWIRAFNERDLARLQELAAPEIEITPLYTGVMAPPGTVYRGHAGLVTLMRAGFEKYKELHSTAAEVMEVGNQLVVDLSVKMRAAPSVAGVHESGAVFEALAGRFIRIESFADAAEAMARARQSQRDLSRRELEILALLARGLTAEGIAVELCLSPHTIRTHVRNAKDKLHAQTVTEAVAIALRRRRPI
jgi:DNA-binding NarL/FixJ family response regulator